MELKEEQPDLRRFNPMTFKEAAKTALAKVQQNRAIRRQFQESSCQSEKLKEQEVRYAVAGQILEETTV